MENKREKIEKEIEKTFEQFVKADKLTPDPYFYSNVKRRLESEDKKEKSLNIILKPALLLILILFNITSIIWYTSVNKVETTISQQKDFIEILSNDLNINQSQENILFEK